MANTGAWIANNIEMGINYVANLAKSIKSIYTSVAAFVAQELAMHGVTLGQYAMNLAMSLNPIGLVIAGVALLVGGLVLAYNKFEWFRDGFKTMVNGIIGALNSLIKGINKISFKLPEALGGAQVGFSIPTIPKLARGGIIDQPTLAMVGEAGKEAVMPLENNTGWITNLAGQIAAIMAATRSNNSNVSDRAVEIVIQLGGTEFVRFVIDSINKLQQQEGRTLIKV
jgi:hypothetical protein